MSYRLNFKVKFTCKCGCAEKSNFILEVNEDQSLELFCKRCERKYVMKVLTKELT